MSLLEQIIAMIAPHRCVQCKAEGALLCADCRKTLPPTVVQCYRCHKVAADNRTCAGCRRVSNLVRVQAVADYGDAVKRLVWRMKFERARAAGTEIGELLAPLLADAPDDVLIVPVPTAPSRVRQRGYDQAAVIARAATRKAGKHYASLLTRNGRARQVGMTRQQRQTQLAGAFTPRNIAQIRNAHVILVDDVITTGATLEAAASALKAAGAKTVEAVVFARA